MIDFIKLALLGPHGNDISTLIVLAMWLEFKFSPSRKRLYEEIGSVD